jgi:hypothetical protein
MQNLSTLALSKMISISQISIIRVHFDTMLLGNIDQFLTSYKMTANENTQIIMYNGTTNDTTLYFNISGVISDGNQAQLLSADLASLQGSLDETAVLQTFTTTTIASVPKYQKFVLKSGYGIKLSVFDPNNIGDYIDLDISITKNPDKTPVEIKP